MKKKRIRFHGRMIKRAYSPKYYDIPLLLETVKDEQLKFVTVDDMKQVEGYDHPMIVLHADSNLLRQTESHYEDLLRKRNNHLDYDELRKLMPEERRNADLSDRKA